MCGLVGIYSKDFLSLDEKRLFRTLLIANYLRGVDASGIITVSQDREVDWFKTLDPSPKFAFSDEYRNMAFALGGAAPVLMLGHTRSGTVGDNNDPNNAHPFATDKYIGMHNGTIWEDFKESRNFGTDSEAIYNLITKDGLEETLKYLNKSCWEPAYALQMVSLEDMTLKIVRNDTRSLWMTFIGKGSTLVWSSDISTLKWALAQHKEVSHRGNWQSVNKDNLILDPIHSEVTASLFQLKPNVLLTLDLNSYPSLAKLEKIDVPEYQYRSFRGRAPTTTSRSLRVITNTSSPSEEDKKLAELILKNLRRNKPATITATIGEGKRSKSINHLFQNYRGYGNRMMKKKEVLLRLSEGCSTCGRKIEEHDTEEISQIKWVARDKFCCSACQSIYTDEELKTFAQA